MEVLNKLTAQIRDLFQSMTPGARITAGLLLAVVVTSFAFLFRQGFGGPDEYLFGAETFNGKQMAVVQAALAKVGNDYRIEGNRVLVPRSKRDIYIAAVADAGALPRDIGSIMTEALDGGSFLESREAKQLRTQAARESQMSHLIGLMPWVDQASVILSIEEPRGLKRTRPASATVSVVPLPGEMLDGRRVDNLKKFVAGTHPSLSVESVVVTNLGDDSIASSSVSPHDFDNPMHRLRASIQQAKREEITKLLSYIPGVRVEVSAKLDDTVDEIIRDVKPVQPGVLLRSSTDTEKSTQSTGDGGGRPGLEAQGPNRRGPAPALAERNQSEKTRSNTEEVNVVGITESELRRAGYEVEEINASIAVPREYIVNVWKQLNPPAEGEEQREPDETELQLVQTTEISRIENLVEPLLPRLGAGQDEFTQVHVEVVNSIAREPLPEPSVASNAFAWTGRNWGALSMFGLAVFSLLMLRSFVRSDPKGETPEAVALPKLHLETTESTGDESVSTEEEPPRQRLRLRKSHSLKEDLAEIVNEDPDAAATILRNWISNAS